MPATPPSRRLPARFRRLLWRSRRVVVAVCVAAAVGLVVEALRPPPPATTLAVVLARDVPAGTALSDRDLTATPLPVGTVPRTALTDPRAARGSPLAVSLPSGSILTPGLLVGPGLADGAPAGTVVVPVPLADSGSARLARPGSRIHLLASAADQAGTGGPAEVVAEDVLVLAELAPDASGGLLGSGERGPGTVYVATDAHAA
ncbi:SAF domain-containing protein, partial [Georgenia sp. 10Sc9-8]|nr:SAF domain-containing protein [Georgenia halotolerans]